MVDYPSRPSARNLQQRPVTVGAAAQHMILGTLDALVREKVLSEDKALAIFDGLAALAKGDDHAAEVGMILGHWRALFVWLLKQPRPDAPPSSRAA
jgi:hypothetical protein